MNWIANKAAMTLGTSGKITVIIQDNGFIYTAEHLNVRE